MLFSKSCFWFLMLGDSLHVYEKNKAMTSAWIGKTLCGQRIRWTIFIDPQLTPVDTVKDESLSSCFEEPFASHFTLQLLLSIHRLNYLLLHKEWLPLAEKLAISHYISHDKAHQGQSDGRLSCFGRPTVVAQRQPLQRLLTGSPKCQSRVMTLCIGLPVSH